MTRHLPVWPSGQRPVDSSLRPHHAVEIQTQPAACRPPRRRSGSRGSPTITPDESPSPTSATSGPPARTAPTRIASPITGHDMSPKFSPDGKWIAFASNRYGNNDVFVVPSSGGAATRLTFHPRRRRCGGLDARFDEGADPRGAQRRRVSQRRDACGKCRSAAGRKSPLPVDWGAYGSYSPDGRSLAFNRHPSSWTRQHYRSSAAADLWIVEPCREDLHAAPAQRALQPHVADVGHRQHDLLRRRSAAERQQGHSRQPRDPQERQQHLQDSRRPAVSPCR